MSLDDERLATAPLGFSNHWTLIEPHKVVLLQISVALLTVMSNSGHGTDAMACIS
jgi:hypothetical protein